MEQLVPEIVGGLIVAAVLLVVTLVWTRVCPAPLTVGVSPAIEYGPMSGVGLAVSRSFVDDVNGGMSPAEVKEWHKITYLAGTPLSLMLTDSTVLGRAATTHIREVWLTLVDFTPFEEATAEEPILLNIHSVAAGGRGSDAYLGGKLCTTTVPTSVPLLQLSALSDGCGSYRLSVDRHSELEIELVLLAAAPGRYTLDIDIEVTWWKSKRRITAIEGLRIFEAPSFEWASAQYSTFVWQDWSTNVASTFAEDWRRWRSEHDVPCEQARRFIPLRLDG